jgi:sulfur carrier protein ThiS
VHQVRGLAREAREVEQTLAGALNYPRGDGHDYPADEFVVTVETAPMLAAQAAQEIRKQRARVSVLLRHVGTLPPGWDER